MYEGDEELGGVKVKRFSSGDADVSVQAALTLLDELEEDADGMRQVLGHEYCVDAEGNDLAQP